MDATAGGGDGRGGGGGSDPARIGGGGAGLTRFRSAPATWLDALLEDDLTRDDALKVGPSSGGLTQLLTAGTSDPPAGGSGGLARSNSSSSYNISAAADPGFFDGGGPHQQQQQQSGLGGFHRMNSSPAEFLSGNIDGYFSNFAMGGNYEFLGGSQMEISPTGKRMRENDSELPSPSKFASQLKGEPGGASSMLDLEMEKLLEDTVPCRVRAKRGCATHPRSIAERVRRTRISDRIRKLQELVPNMEKQTNTADMLEEAVEYVKRLQKQIEELTEIQKKCTCAAKE